jgi:hypothetical protein
MKRGQISLEYLIVIGFITFIIISLLGVAFFYSTAISDRIRVNQITNFANKIISNSESVFFAGEPSKVTINAYLPTGVNNVEVVQDNEVYLILITFSTGSGASKIAFSSNVPLLTDSEYGNNVISSSSGLKKIEIIAQSDKVYINDTLVPE